MTPKQRTAPMAAMCHVHGRSSLNDIAIDCCMSDSIYDSLVTKDGQRDTSTLRGYSVPDDTTHRPSHSCVGNATVSCSATSTNNIIQSYSMSENSTNGVSAPDISANVCCVPDDSTNRPEDDATSYCMPDYTADLCCMQQNVRLRYQWSDDIAVTAAAEHCVSASHCQLSCPPIEMHSEDVISGSDAVSETLNDAGSVTLEHGTVRETVTRSFHSQVL